MTRVHFATNRRPYPKDRPTRFGAQLHPDGVGYLRFGTAEVARSKVTLDVAPETLVPDADRIGTDMARSMLGSQRIFEHLRTHMAQDGCDCIIYVHGYNASLTDGLRAAARLGDRLAPAGQGAGVIPALFSWPSDGSLAPWLAYASDRQDAAASGPALGRALLKFADFMRTIGPRRDCGRRVHLMAHSMGAYVLRHALAEVIAHSGRRLPRVFDQLFLMAADEDDDAFEHATKLARLPELARRVNVYINRQDRALEISDYTKANPARLGETGPRHPLQVPGKVTTIDTTPVVHGAIEHSYHLESDAVVADILQSLDKPAAQTIANRRHQAQNNFFELVASA